MDVDYSVCKCYDFDVWFPVSEYNQNNYKKKPPVLSESKFAQNERWSDALESYPSFGSFACDIFDGDDFRNVWGHRVRVRLRNEFINYSEGWDFHWLNYVCDTCNSDCISMVQIQNAPNICAGELALE